MARRDVVQIGKRAGRSRHTRSVRWVILVALASFVMLLHGKCVAQPGITSPQSSPEPTRQQNSGDEEIEREDEDASSPDEEVSSVRFVGPDTYILLDDQGRPQAFPNLKYEDFMEVWQQLNHASKPAVREPRYSIQQLRITGATRESHAELSVRLQVLLLTDEMVRIPLQLGGAIVETEFENHTPQAGQYLVAEDENGSLVAWIRGTRDEQRELTLKLLVPLQRRGNETALRLTCPRAVSSQLTLDVPGPLSSPTASGEAVLSEHSLTEGVTRLVATGVVGDCELRWRTTRPESFDRISPLRAQGAISAQIDGHSVRMDARLTVRSFGGSAFDQFYVRLPPGATFLPINEGDAASRDLPYATVPLEPGATPDGVDDETDGDWVLVRLRTRQPGPVEISLASEQPLRLRGSDLIAELSGFEVLGAIRQFGDIALIANDQWQFHWEPVHQVRQVDLSDSAVALPAGSYLATFKYDSQPWSLRVRVLPRSSRVHVVPKYELKLLPEEAHLRAEFDYFVSGARTIEYRADLRGWRVVATSATGDSGAAIDTDVTLQTGDGMLVLRLKDAAPRGTKVVVEARRDLPSASNELELPLPAPVADVVGSGELVVLSPPQVALAPDASQSEGLIPEASLGESTSATDDPVGYQPLFYRTFLAEPIFATKRMIRSRRVMADVQTAIQFGSETGEVDQVIHYQVDYQSIQRLELQLPESLTDPESQLRVELLGGSGDRETGGSIPLDIVELAGSRDVPADRSQHLVQLPLPRPLLGHFDVHVHYLFEARIPPNTVTQSADIPLVIPLDGVLGSHVATVTASPSVVASIAKSVDSNPWQVESTPDLEDEPSVRAVATERVTTLPLILERASSSEPRTTTIERVWFQAWFAEELQQHRCVYQFRTAERAVSIELPSGVDAGQVEVLLDGTPMQPVVGNSGPVVVSISQSSGRPVHILELVYRQTASLGIVGRQRITPPLLAGAQPASQTYWQIVLPEDAFLIGRSPELASASHWSWTGSHLGRAPLLDQAGLEQWSGAVSRQAPSSDENQQLFYSLSGVSSLEVLVCRRWLTVLAASSIALAIGLLLANIPELRHPRVLAVLAVGLLIASFAFPQQALLVGQAAGLGVALAVVSIAVRQYAVARNARRWAPSGSAITVRTPIGYDTHTPSPRTSTLAGASSASARTVDSAQ